MEAKDISWDDIDEEKMQAGLARKVVHGTNITMARISLSEGIVVPSHSHHNEQISYVLKGSIRVETDSGSFIVDEGHMLVIPPDVPHKVTALRESLVQDTFSPLREDWLNGDDGYLR